MSMVLAAMAQQTTTHGTQPFRKFRHPEERRLGNRSRQEGVGSVRDGTVSELHPRQLTLGAIRLGVKQYNGASKEMNDPGMLRASVRSAGSQNQSEHPFALSIRYDQFMPVSH